MRRDELLQCVREHGPGQDISPRLLRYLIAEGVIDPPHGPDHAPVYSNRHVAQFCSYFSLKEQGWQSAVESIYPFKLDRVKVEDGSMLYLASAPTSKPLQLTKVFMVARNIRNKAVVQGAYPSPVTQFTSTVPRFGSPVVLS